MRENEIAGIRVSDPTTLEQRQAVAETACARLHLDFPAVVDNLDNKVGVQYAGWPDRIYAVRADGKIGFKSGPGPWGFDPDRLAEYLRKTVGPPGAASPSTPKTAIAAPSPGQLAPALTGRSITGQPLSLAALRGKVVVLDFWATWCPGCREAMGDLAQLYTRFHPQGLEILGVSLDGPSTGADLEAVTKLVKEKSIPWPQFYEGAGWESPIALRYGIASLPTTVLVGKDGKIIATGLSAGALETAISQALGNGSVRG